MSAIVREGDPFVIDMAVDADDPDHGTITVTARVLRGPENIDAATLAVKKAVAQIGLDQCRRGFTPTSETTKVVIERGLGLPPLTETIAVVVATTYVRPR